MRAPTGDQIHDARRRLGLTASNLAAIAGVSMTTIFNWEASGADHAPARDANAEVLVALVACSSRYADRVSSALAIYGPRQARLMLFDCAKCSV